MVAGNAYQRVMKGLVSLIPASLPTVQEYAHSWSCMSRHLEIAEITTDALSALPLIHVAGTKGKGSTCAMIEVLLRSSNLRTGLFTSPHLCDVRERIRLDGQMIDADVFVSEADWLLHRYHQEASVGHPMPGYFQFLTAMALRSFVSHRVDVAILEVGLGGRLDPTNIIPPPIVCGITSLGYDHTELLGSSLKAIAGEKAGIFKQGSIAFTVPQFEEAKDVLQQRAEDAGIPLVDVGHFAPFRNLQEIKNPQFKGGYQTLNTTLAVHMAMAFEEAAWKLPKRPALRSYQASYQARMDCLRTEHRLPEPYVEALSSMEWPGRAQIIRDADVLKPKASHRQTNAPSGCKNLVFYLDGAHTAESLSACINWYASETSTLIDPLRIMFFNCQPSKNAWKLLASVRQGLTNNNIDFDHVFFVPPISRRLDMESEFRHERSQLQIWKSVCQETKTIDARPISQILNSDEFVKVDVENVRGSVFPSVLSAVGWIRNFTRDYRMLNVHVLVTGSLYLVGDVLRLLGRAPQ